MKKISVATNRRPLPMQHPNNRQLQLFVIAQLDAAEEKTIEKHLAECPECARRVANIQNQINAASTQTSPSSVTIFPPPPPPPPMSPSKSAEEHAATVWKRRLGAVLAVLLLMGAAAFFLLSSKSEKARPVAVFDGNPRGPDIPAAEKPLQVEQEPKAEQEIPREIPLQKMQPEIAQSGDGDWQWKASDPAAEKLENDLWARSPSRFVFRLDKRWKTFKSFYGLPIGADLKQAICVFIVKGDGRELYRSEAIRDHIIRPLELDVGNVEALELIVEPHEPNSNDNGVWFTPMLTQNDVQPFVEIRVFATEPTPEEDEHVQKVREREREIPEALLKFELGVNPGSGAGGGQFTSDGTKFVAPTLWGAKYHVFDLATAKPTMSFGGPGKSTGPYLHPNGQIAAVEAQDGNVLQFWNIDNGEKILEIPAHGKGFRGCFSPDGSLFVSGSQEGTAVIWDTATGVERKRFHAHTDEINAVDISPDGKLWVTGSKDKSIRVWEIETGHELCRLYGHDKSVRAVTFNHRGTILASGSDDQTVVFWDVNTGRPIKRLVGCEQSIQSLAFSPDDSQLVLGCLNGFYTSVWDVNTGLPLYRLPTCRVWGTTKVAFSKDGKMIATCSDDPIAVWEVPSPEELAEREQELKEKRETTKEILLRDMPPPEHGQTGYVGWRWGTFDSAEGEHEKSLYASTYSRYVFRLDKQWKTFKTQYGLRNDSDLSDANAVFIVIGDGKELFRSEEVHDFTARPLKADVTDVEFLELIVEQTGTGIWFTPTLLRDVPFGEAKLASMPPPAPGGEPRPAQNEWPGKTELAAAPSDFITQGKSIADSIKKSGGYAVAGQVVDKRGGTLLKGMFTVAVDGNDTYRFDDGWFITRKQPRSATKVVNFSAAAFRLEEAEFPLQIEQGKVNFLQVVLAPPSKEKLATLKGIVRDEKGRPIDNVPISLVLSRSNGYFGMRATLKAVTDAQGAYSFPEITSQIYQFDISQRQYRHSGSYATIRPGNDITVPILEKSTDGLTRQEENGLITTLLLPRRVLVETVYQPDGTTNFNKRNVVTNRYGLELYGSYNTASGDQKIGSYLVFDPSIPNTDEVSGKEDIMMTIKDGACAVGLRAPNNMTQNGIYSLGKVNFDSVKEAEPDKIQKSAIPCEVNHVYVVRTFQKGHYAKFVIRGIVILDP